MNNSLLLNLAALTAGAEATAKEPLTETILDAAMAQFQDFGLRRTSMEDVAKRAGVSRITIYRRFPQKDRLIQATLLREVRGLIRGVRAVMQPLPRIEDRIVEGFVFGMHTIHTHPLLSRLLALEPEEVLVFLTVKANPLIAAASLFLADQIRTAQREGKLPDYAPQPVAEILVRIAHSLMLTPKSGTPLNTDEQARAFARSYILPIILRGPQV